MNKGDKKVLNTDLINRIHGQNQVMLEKGTVVTVVKLKKIAPGVPCVEIRSEEGDVYDVPLQDLGDKQ